MSRLSILWREQNSDDGKAKDLITCFDIISHPLKREADHSTAMERNSSLWKNLIDEHPVCTSWKQEAEGAICHLASILFVDQSDSWWRISALHFPLPVSGFSWMGLTETHRGRHLSGNSHSRNWLSLCVLEEKEIILALGSTSLHLPPVFSLNWQWHCRQTLCLEWQGIYRKKISLRYSVTQLLSNVKSRNVQITPDGTVSEFQKILW